ncbi:hypothetical protein ACHAQJ_006940 [Trichoderma viride]
MGTPTLTVIAAPDETQKGVLSNCNKFAEARPGQGCANFSAAKIVSTTQLRASREPLLSKVDSNVNHQGYALQKYYKWFEDNPDAAKMRDKGTSTPNCRHNWAEAVGVVIISTNSIHATREETVNKLGFDECQDDKCSWEIEALKMMATSVREIAPTIPSDAIVEPTPAVNKLGGSREE